MPKLKTRKALKKRVKVTATGKVLRHRAGRRHLAASKTSKRKRALRRAALVFKGEVRSVRRLMVE